MMKFVIWSIIGGIIWFLCMIPFWYALAHGSEFFSLIPIIGAIIGWCISPFMRSEFSWLRYIAYFFILICIIFCSGVLYYFILLPKWTSEKIITTVTSIFPREIVYTPIIWSGNTIGISVQAKFDMNPDIKDVTPHSYLPILPKISLNPYSYSQRESIFSNWTYLLSGSVLLPGVAYENNNFCYQKNQYGSTQITWNYTGNLLYPYIEWACFRWWICFTQYIIPRSEFFAYIDKEIYAQLPFCNFRAVQ